MASLTQVPSRSPTRGLVCADDKSDNLTNWVLLGVFVLLAFTTVPVATFFARGLADAIKHSRAVIYFRPFVKQCLAPIAFLLSMLYLELAFIFAPWPCNLDGLQAAVGVAILLFAMIGCIFLIFRLFSFVDVVFPIYFKKSDPILVRSTAESLRVIKLTLLVVLCFVLAATILSRAGATTTFAIILQLNVFTMPIWVAVSFILRDVVGGVQFLVDRPFQMGDFVEIDGTKGSVVNVGLFAAHVRTFEGMSVNVPLARIVETVVIVYRQGQFRAVEFEVPVDNAVADSGEDKRLLLTRAEHALKQRDEYRMLSVSFAEHPRKAILVRFLVAVPGGSHSLDVHIRSLSEAVRETLRMLCL